MESEKASGSIRAKRPCLPDGIDKPDEVKGRPEGEKAPETGGLKPKAKWRRRLPAALALIACLILPQNAGKPGARDMLRAADQSGMTPGAFYISATRAVSGESESVLRGASQCLAGLPNARVSRTLTADGALLAAAIVTPPTAWAAAEAVHRLESALGRQAEITVCLTGKTQPAKSAPDAAETAKLLLRSVRDEPLSGVSLDPYASYSGEWAQTAIRANGDAYVGVPLIPLDY